MTPTLRVARVVARIAVLIRDGVPTRDAIDAVCGTGAYDQLASDLYDQLRAKQSPTT